MSRYLEVESHDDKTEDGVRKVFRSVKVYLEHYLKLLATAADQKRDISNSSNNGSQKELCHSAITAEAMQNQMTFVR